MGLFRSSRPDPIELLMPHERAKVLEARALKEAEAIKARDKERERQHKERMAQIQNQPAMTLKQDDDGLKIGVNINSLTKLFEKLG